MLQSSPPSAKGFLMDDIHAPTVASGPSSARPARDVSKLSMPELMQEKERIEMELSALSSVLNSHGVTMRSTLTTFDGYPRDDIDIAQVRTTRVRIIHLRNDHKEVMTHLEKGLHDHFARLQNTPGATTNGTNVPSSAPTSATDSTSADAGTLGTPFARVNSVEPGSPAHQAGLKTGDSIRSFGSVHWLNHERLSKVAEAVQQNEGRPLSVKVTRRNEGGPGTVDLDLQLTPRRNWGGRGLLGCHLVPL
ncbi:26S proteasome non-ATPase regulatory subunit 9 [Penicillium maclennaniae]|uniref:26S proteasome non-ATPase regulatory subunit 9 n=1 Tax=Penicillium maclennaniae TaxID=1343394 RepID=UPI002542393A|nr:26S proteasome non-ATPase regulatory subunit 9 [Penicillium maclennaniae]KAJ5662539.1 26S proteasome non-ATPase regulatory subunit 9 [Penicillium maclennaniae]